jgi:hypothetical protein
MRNIQLSFLSEYLTVLYDKYAGPQKIRSPLCAVLVATPAHTSRTVGQTRPCPQLRLAYLGPPGREEVERALVPSYSCARQSGQVQPALSLSGDIPAHLALFFCNQGILYCYTYRPELDLFHTDSGSVKKRFEVRSN